MKPINPESQRNPGQSQLIHQMIDLRRESRAEQTEDRMAPDTPDLQGNGATGEAVPSADQVPSVQRLSAGPPTKKKSYTMIGVVGTISVLAFLIGVSAIFAPVRGLAPLPEACAKAFSTVSQRRREFQERIAPRRWR